jgi:outer membrane lipoprotein-sorting protein
MTLRQIFAATCAILAAATAQAQGGDFAARLKAASAAMETIECDFTLTRKMSVMAADAVSEGRFSYLRGAGISLDFSKPAGDRITMGRERFTIVSAGKASTVKLDSNPMLKHLSRMLTACMTGDVEMLGRGATLAFEQAGAGFKVTVTPSERRARGMVSRMVLTFDGGDMSLTALRMEEASGDVSEYRFFNKTFNGKVDPAIFNIK